VVKDNKFTIAYLNNGYLIAFARELGCENSNPQYVLNIYDNSASYTLKKPLETRHLNLEDLNLFLQEEFITYNF
jgi:hypothetical protein